eukprot:4980019-Prymnesium_polylepis.1
MPMCEAERGRPGGGVRCRVCVCRWAARAPPPRPAAHSGAVFIQLSLRHVRRGSWAPGSRICGPQRTRSKS